VSLFGTAKTTFSILVGDVRELKLTASTVLSVFLSTTLRVVIKLLEEYKKGSAFATTGIKRYRFPSTTCPVRIFV